MTLPNNVDVLGDLCYLADAQVVRASPGLYRCMLMLAAGANLVQSPFGVSEEGDAVPLSDTDGHGGEASG